MHSTTLKELAHDHSFGMERRRVAERRTLIVLVLTAAAMVVEVAAGLAFGSMALLADGIHMASHALALGIGVLVYVYARRLAGDPRLSFGSGKLNALGGYSSALLLAGIAVAMGYESAARLLDPVPIDFDLAILVAFGGLAVNGASVAILNVRGRAHAHDDPGEPDHEDGHRHDGDHNLRAVFLHVVADAATSVLALIALAGAKYAGAVWLDPVMGLVGAAVILWWAQGLMRASGGVLLDRQAPAKLRDEIRRRIERVEDNRIADLHVWSVGPSLYAAELVVVSHRPAPPQDYRDLLADLGLVHVVVEPRTCPDPQCP